MRRCLRCEATWSGGGWTCPACAWSPGERDGVLTFAPELDRAGPSYDPELCHRLAAVEARSFWFRARNRLIAWALDRHFPEARGLLEIGCGTGFVLAGLRAARPMLQLAGSDLLTAGLAAARQRVPDARLYQLDARRIPWRDGWDVIGAFDVLEHIPEDEEVLAEARRAVRPGGGLLVAVPQHRWLWSAADEQAHHQRRYTRPELERKVRAAGFRVEWVTSFVSTLLPAMAAARLRPRGQGGADLEAELCCPAPLNAAFERALGLELALIRWGVSLPAGGSLFLAARRPG